MKKWLVLLSIFTLGFISHLYLVYVFKPDIKPTYSVSTVHAKTTDGTHSSNGKHSGAEKKSKVFVGYIKLAGISYLGEGNPQNKAVIENLLASKQKEYALNDPVPFGGKLTQILKDRVVIKNEGQERTVRLLEKIDDPEARKFLLADGHHKTTENQWVLMPNHLKMDKKVEHTLLSTEISPHFTKGVQRFRIDSFPKGSLFEKLGFQAGDSIITIDGEELTDIKHVLRICWKIRKSSLLNVKLERNHHPVSLSYRIISENDV